MDKPSENSSLLDILLDEFKSQGLKLSENVVFSKWKLCDLRKFLKMTNTTGFSKANKESVVEKADFIWSNLKADPTIPPTPLSQASNINNSNNQHSIKNNNGNPTQIPRTPEFMKWNMHKLQDFLGDRGINRTGNKQTLVRNALGAYNMNLPITETDVKEELDEVKNDTKNKLFVEGGMIQLPDPLKLINGWVPAPENLPNTLFEQIKEYLDVENAGKAYKGGQSLLDSGHLSNIMSHAISVNIRYCFVRALCLPEQKLTKAAYNVWIVLHKDSGNVVTGDCSCPAGYVCYY